MTSYQTRDVVKKVADYIEALPEGSRTTTGSILVKLYGKETASKMDDFMLHFEIYDERDTCIFRMNKRWWRM